MAVTPDTTIKILKVPIEIDNLNQLTFSSASAQFDYFNSCPKIVEEELYYQRKDNYILFPKHIDEIIEYNYVMYQNSNYSNKWFYAFITNMEYENDGCTRIYIETDVIQTWYFEITYKASFVEREHVNDDTIGKNVLPEGLQLGEYVTNKKAQWLNNLDGLYTNSNLAIVIGVTSDKDKNAKAGMQVDGIYSGVTYYGFENSTNDIALLNSWLEDYAQNGISEAIKCMFMIPKELIVIQNNTHLIPGSSATHTRFINTGGTTPVEKSIDLANTNLDGYSPVNNKLKTFPYSFLMVSNNSGSDVIYRYEDFYTVSNNVKTLIANPSFKIESVLTPSGSVRMIPYDYKGVHENDLEGLNMGKFPVCSWATDVYTNWLTQNGVNIALSVAGSLLATTTGAITGNAVGVASGILGVANTLGEIYKESLTPPQSEGNINAGDVVTSSGNNDFHFEVRSIKKEMAQIIDSYFSMYGYKVNEVKVPNITGRTYWNYVKTINCNIEGNIPQNDIQKIKDIFNNGVTFWHDPTKFLDYTQSNTIVTP